MQQALYHPEHGYYSSGRCTIGRNGDYFTNVSVGPLFGRLLALQFCEVWERVGKTANFVITEQGAHDGQFAHDVLGFVQHRLPEFFQALRYSIIEPFSVLEERQRAKLKVFGGKVGWRKSPEPFTGIHFSNELLDAIPVRLISDTTEKLVDVQGERFVFVERHVDKTTHNHNERESIDPAAVNLERGYLIVIDYGFLDENAERQPQVRAAHRNLDSPFEQIGYADITMSVDWKSIIERACGNGLRVAGFTDQYHFLTGILSEFAIGDIGEPALLGSHKAKRELQTLLHPEMLGRAFQVLALAKNVEVEPPLAGFKFARPLDTLREDAGPFS
jgi:SAM-dependent MidA family methyltransferase